MYEVILATSGIQQIGWATIDTPFTAEEGVGDAPNSYAWDGKRVQRWNVRHYPYGTAWCAGDIIGVCVDMEAGTMRFYKNGVDMGGASPPTCLRTGCSSGSNRLAEHGNNITQVAHLQLSFITHWLPTCGYLIG